MYAVTLIVHSWLRWLLLLAGLLLLARAARALRRNADWSGRDVRAVRLFVGLADLQLMLGLLLYVVLSPIVRIALSDLRAAMASSVLRFFVVEHITAMAIAVVVLHVGKLRALRAASARGRHKGVLLTVSLFLACVLIGIPWPFRQYGRPLLRTSLGVLEPTARVPNTYTARCAVCHGASGHGDGVAAGSMVPAPRDFRDARWQRSASDAQLRALIQQGGVASGLSANMPAHPDLSRAELDELVRFVRSRAAPAR